ncbi:hypothetical protein [Pseudobacteroides cellulosolvens]|uniref:Uncharacterized protein n=1 Tax=Pseudobacteroides cellulosolvens ATCC 35603 = DSM 2933 TaxID=398512 RepID=A0A0L6JNI4_9FIRM|nr:hypothetical protein [Pseudobacteroides cellulosolvens]KNY27381.1 hypothetical protein Bccel_2652 [Pseudobacteroides cellulosolvens ATCC 35603 = DSM 2933]
MLIQWRSSLPKFILTVTLSLSLLASCGKIEEEPYNKPVVETNSLQKDSSTARVDPSKKLLFKTFEELAAANDEHTLEIRKKGYDKAYKASDILIYTILDMLQKSEKLDTVAIDNPGFDYNKYDYSLEFAGANQILLSVEDNTFYMKEDGNIYKLWGDSSAFWKSLSIDEAEYAIDLPDEIQDSMKKAYRHDADGDGTADDVVLSFYKARTKDSNGQLKLKVGLSEVNVEDEIGWVSEPYHIMYDTPTVEFIPSNKGSIIAISYSWMTNGVGMTGEIKAYEYRDKKLRELKVDLPDMDFRYEKGGKVKIGFPQINKELTAVSSKEDVESVEKDSKLQIEKVLKDKEGFYPHIYRYICKDFNGDGKAELCSQSLIRFQTPSTMSLGYLYTIYKYDNGGIIPESVKLLPPYDEKDKMRMIKNDVVENLFSLGFLDFAKIEDKELWSNMESQYGKSDFEKAITELFEEGYIKKNNDKIFLNL